jgi:hypothetical protein
MAIMVGSAIETQIQNQTSNTISYALEGQPNVSMLASSKLSGELRFGSR